MIWVLRHSINFANSNERKKGFTLKKYLHLDTWSTVLKLEYVLIGASDSLLASESSTSNTVIKYVSYSIYHLTILKHK